ncbi:MAG: ribonuclease [Oscillospiraceae bacterium]|nr:ribonuclease [Oscillospiraceae bacterium]
MKKVLSLLLILSLLFSLAACVPKEDKIELPTVENTSESTNDSEGNSLEDPLPDSSQADPTESAPADQATEPVTEAPTAPTEATPESTAPTTTEAPTQEYPTEENELPIDFFDDEPAAAIAEDGVYTSKDDVALYIHTYGHLPSNFITKNEARSLGWEGGSLEPYAPGKCIGGDRFGNYEGLLPTDRKYTECDIDTLGAKSRGAKRLVFSSDGLIYYTDDHYESFTLLYGEE